MAKATLPAAESMSVSEMLRIMDVATAIRQDRELVDEELNLDALKARLRDRMLAASKVTGEDVTPEEIDTAIAQYYSSLHAFHEPPLSPAVALAHLWVRRWSIVQWGACALGFALLAWSLFLSPSGAFTVTGRAQKRVAALNRDITKRAGSIQAVAQDESIRTELERLTSEAAAYRKQDDEAKLRTVDATLADLDKRLREEYTVVVQAKGKSAIIRAFKDEQGKRVSGHYLIVEAKTADGRVLTRRIHEIESGKDENVTTWAELVPKEVYDRLAEDKRSDGILNETEFAVKRRGFPEETVTMPGVDGRPLTRAGQITKW
jgi:Family of unknown function (DUF6384)